MDGKEIDLNKWDRKDHFEGYLKMANPCYGINVRIDVTKLVKRCKENKESFFINMLYICSNEMMKIEEFKMRIVDNKPYIYNNYQVSFSIMNDYGYYVIREVDLNEYQTFYNDSKKILEVSKKEKSLHIKNYDYNVNNMFYFSSVPWIDFEGLSQPFAGDVMQDSIPKVGWGKYVKENDKYKMTLHLTVNHALVDGKPLSDLILNIQEEINKL
ncbi:CatA-like O-acetyltransferase [Mycoplasma sp. P36-A1]|uniref:CatA-like O-acetyltransferase n=1 Tax=Mycoplasma sp. P36-A1 TaxID=3252900 RepID=UPI003C2D00AD